METCDKCGKEIKHWAFKIVKDNGDIICKKCSLENEE